MAIWEGNKLDTACEGKINAIMAASTFGNVQFCVAYDKDGNSIVLVPNGIEAYEYITPTSMANMTIRAEIPIMLRSMELDNGEAVSAWCSGGPKPRWWAAGPMLALKTSLLRIIEPPPKDLKPT